MKNEIAEAVAKRRTEFADMALNARLEQEWVDVTLPGRERRTGSIHPISQVFEEVTAIFADMGFDVAEGPQIEDDWHNFDALNIPPEHPARQEHDTFFIKGARKEGNPNVLRTHTSPVQIRAMKERGAPIRIIAPGRVYRCDYDQTHTPMFHQVEGLALDVDVSMANLKWVLEEFCRAFFQVDEAELRFRASHFPFTEPSAEGDLRCSWSGGRLEVGTGDDWMEILGCGMVHPNVLRSGGVDPEKYQGFAFGLGLDRLAMLKYGIPDLRAFFESDVRWLRHYGFSALGCADFARRTEPLTPPRGLERTGDDRIWTRAPPPKLKPPPSGRLRDHLRDEIGCAEHRSHESRRILQELLEPLVSGGGRGARD